MFLRHSRRLAYLFALLSIVILPNWAISTASARTFSEPELVQIAQTLIQQNSSQWNVNGGELKVAKVIATDDGLNTIRFTQTIAGVPVLNSLFAVTLLSDGTLLSHVSKLSTAPAVGPAQISAGKASEIALAAFSTKYALSLDSSSVVDATVQFADPALVDFVHGEAQLIWQVKIQNSNQPQLASSVFVSDRTTQTLAIREMSRAFGAFPMPYVCDLQKTKPTARFAADVSSKRIGNLIRKYIGQAPDYPLCEQRDPGRIANSSASSIRAITETVKYFRNKIGVDIAAEQYLGNIAPYAKDRKSVV